MCHMHFCDLNLIHAKLMQHQYNISKTACCYENQFIPGNPLVCLLRCLVGHDRSVHLISTTQNTLKNSFKQFTHLDKTPTRVHNNSVSAVAWMSNTNNNNHHHHFHPSLIKQPKKWKVFQLFTRISHRFFSHSFPFLWELVLLQLVTTLFHIPRYTAY